MDTEKVLKINKAIKLFHETLPNMKRSTIEILEFLGVDHTKSTVFIDKIAEMEKRGVSTTYHETTQEEYLQTMADLVVNGVGNETIEDYSIIEEMILEKTSIVEDVKEKVIESID